MKKNLTTTLFIALIAMLVLFSGCSNGTDIPVETTTSTEKEIIHGIEWATIKDPAALQDYYWNSSPIDVDYNGMTYYESTENVPSSTEGEYLEILKVTWLEDESGKKLYSPRLSKDGTILYLDKYGYIEALDKELEIWNVVSNTFPEDDYKIIFSSPEVTVFWSSETTTIVEKKRNEIIRTEELPANSEYCGYSYWAGFIFKCEDAVYSVFAPHEDENVILAAEGVKNIISTDFELTSDAWSNPLFLMEDGSLKGYITWEDELYEFNGAVGTIYFPYNIKR